MPFQVTALTKTLLTMWTVVWLVQCVCAEVLLYVTSLAETFPTVLASVGLVPSVYPDVITQVSTPAETLATVGTQLVRRKVLMHPNVPLEVCLFSELLVALLASEGLGIGHGTHWTVLQVDAK